MKKGSVYQVFRVGGKWFCDPVFDDCDSSISNTLRDIVQLIKSFLKLQKEV